MESREKSMDDRNKKNKMRSSRTDNILYELLVYSEWKQEPDFTRSPNKPSHGVRSFLYNPLSHWKKTDSSLEEIMRLQNWLLPWQLAVGEDGKVVAILQENILEIRTSRDEYSSVVGKATVVRDGNPQWRKMVWSPDCSMLAVGGSNGSVCFYDLLGCNLFNIPPLKSNEESQLWSADQALAAVVFLSLRSKNPKWSSELLLVSYGGHLRSFFVSPSEGYLEYHSVSLSRSGITSVAWHPTHHMIFFSSTPDTFLDDFKNDAIRWGLNGWRLLNDYPYYKREMPSDEDYAKADARKGFRNWISSFHSSHRFSVVFKMQISPNGQFLACIHSCGTVSVWQLPSLRVWRIWYLMDQPGFNTRNMCERKKYKDSDTEEFCPIDLTWWGDQKIIIARKNGAVTVCEINELRNLLGESPEFLCSEPRLSPVCSERGFLALECESSYLSTKRKSQQQESTVDQEESSDSDEEGSLVNKSSALVQSTVYLITDMERFQPKKKKTKIVVKIYRLLGLKSTTPEELFSRKIDNEEYGDALSLAQVYNLDVDRVYQRQWRNSPVSIATIYDYLSKISKKSWVLHECCQRVPETLSAARELIQFGLKSTDIVVVVKDADDDDTSLETDIIEESEEKKIWNKLEYIRTIPVDNLSDEQKHLIKTRIKLLQYSDRLFTYELILNGSDGNFDREFYDKFRRQPAVLSAIEFARQANDKAVELLLTYQGEETLPHWLTILENFPETVNPSDYRSLLPECTADGELYVWEQSQIRQQDWCEDPRFRYLSVETVEIEAEPVYEVPKPHELLTTKVLEEWYRNRIYEIENRSHMVDQALELAKLARERNIKGLENVYSELVTLDVLVYDMCLEDITLSQLEKLSSLEKTQLLMCQSTEESFVEDVRHRLVPYLLRCDKLVPKSRHELLSQYLFHLSESDLTLPLKLFEYLQSEPENTVVINTKEQITLAVECVYAYASVDQFDKASAILRTLPERYPGQYDKELLMLYERVTEAEAELNAAEILSRYNNARAIAYIHKHRQDLPTIQALLLRMARGIANKVPAASDAEWKNLLQDMLYMQSAVFRCMPLDLCYELYVSTILASGQRQVITSAVRILCCHSEDSSSKQLNLQRSVDLVLQAAREYFDSSSKFSDPGIALAKTCLHLITEDNAEIQEELDLIASLQVLNDFGVDLLPVQVRLCPDRLKLIDLCVNGQANAYKETQKLLSLAHMLRVCGNDARHREGIVLIKIAEAAFEKEDYYFCGDICQRLIQDEQAIGWKIAKRLGQCKDYIILSTKQRLINFALLHCSVDCIQELVNTRCELENEILQLDIAVQTKYLDTGDEDEFVDALTTPETPTKEFLPQLTSKLQTTSSMLIKFTRPDFWKSKFNTSETEEGQKARRNDEMNVQGMPSFYVLLNQNFHESCLFLTYNTFHWTNNTEWKQLNLAQTLLKAALIHQENHSADSLEPIDSVLIQCSTLLFPEDCMLAMCHLLAVSNPAMCEQCFSSLPHTSFTLQLTVYFYALVDALKYYTEAIYWKPDEVVSWAVHNKQVKEHSELLMKSISELEHFEQAQRIEKLNCGVNAQRFTSDTQYKHDSIIGLAMSEDWSKFEIALELAANHNVLAFDVALSHVVALLLSNYYNLLTERLTDNRLSMLLKENPSFVSTRLTETVLPNINGTNYLQLIVYYTVLQLVADNTEFDGLVPREHIKLIKKINATASDIDYKLLITQPKNLLQTLRPAINKNTLTSICKLLKSFPPHLRSAVSVSNLYADWAVTQFHSECLTQNSSEWCMKHFEALGVYFPKMCASDVVQFICDTVFSHEAAKQLDPYTRHEMLKFVVDYCHKQNNNKEWGSTLTSLQHLQHHLSDISSLYSDSMSSEMKAVLHELDVSCGNPEKMIFVVENAVLNASVPNSFIQGLVKFLPEHMTFTAIITKLIKDPDLSCKWAAVLLKRIEQCLDNGQKEDCWSTLIEPLTKSTSIPPQIRLQAAHLLQKLEQNYSGEAETCRLMTEAMLSFPVQISQVCDSPARADFFSQLLEQATTWQEIYNLYQLLFSWPQSEHLLFLRLVPAMVKFNNEDLIPALEKIFNEIKFKEQDIQVMVTQLEEGICDVVTVITVCLLVKYTSLHQKGLALLKQLPDDKPLNHEIVRGIVRTGLTASLVDSPLYSQLVDNLCEDENLCHSAVGQLIEAGYLPEAGTLVLMQTSVTQCLRNFSAAINIVAPPE